MSSITQFLNIGRSHDATDAKGTAATQEDATNVEAVATKVRVRSRDACEANTESGCNKCKGATDAKTGSNRCYKGCNRCYNRCNECRRVQLMQLRCNKCGCNKCSNKCDDNNESNKCSISGCARIVPGARLAVTQQTKATERERWTGLVTY